ncbi:HlyD family secretion protein [Hymenobacter persicinus]|uniref:HlyD family secretion protein n=1 Tax=Hymenobacter persicinus TaxID=2025506 RepID=UPI0013EBEE91|nr:HlyD family efflux transporter periplasmic adaptor subunit [Hymenobacter persicinus]
MPAFAVQERSEDMQDLVEKVPSWIARWGITLIFGLLLLVLWGSYVIQYPDIITVPLRLTTHNFPKPVSSRLEGKLVRLLVQDRQPVRRGQPLAYLESTGNHAQVQRLTRWLEQLEQAMQVNGQPSRRLSAAATSFAYAQLGELQTDFQTFEQARAQYESFASGAYYQQKQGLLEKDLANLEKQHDGLLAQRNLYEQDVVLARQELAAQRELFAQKVIAPLDFKQQQSKFLNRQLPLRQVELSLINNLAQQSAKRNELLDLRHLISQQQGIFNQALRSLHSAASSWERQYILTAPTTGKVFFTSFLQEKQTVQPGQELFSVATQSSTEFGEVQIPQYNLGKVKPGQAVILKFNSYPFQEFGAVRGKIDYISDVPAKNGSFLARIILPQGLRTTYNRQITYRAGMQASAEIITEDSRLLAKIFYNFRRSVSR